MLLTLLLCSNLLFAAALLILIFYWKRHPELHTSKEQHAMDPQAPFNSLSDPVNPFLQDPLTGLDNRSLFLTQLKKSWRPWGAHSRCWRFYASTWMSSKSLTLNTATPQAIASCSWLPNG
ncbi:hypothetical protein [Dongshaea marina]|uniref:hypothetical protein n=1 Tax=Dongshaea marina TaxID=2047966 RepID=UPI00131F0E5F|nr:hypothetical protein [Dongshaea marina]